MKALITGASSGLGKSFAYELAKRGYNLVIVARRKERLDKLAMDLSTLYGIEVESFQTDLTDFNDLQTLVDTHSDVDLLVNNAGFGVIGSFIDTDMERELKMIDLNVKVLYYLTKAYAKTMAGKKGTGIINVASTASYQPVPGFATYAATKAFVLNLTEAISFELDGKVRIMTLCPGATKTKFFETAGATAIKIRTMSPEDVVVRALKAFERGKKTYIPGISNKAMVFFQRFVSRRIVIKSAAKLFLNERKDSYKLAKEEE
ncbi:SDR family NAD(P)-dependent oxidoreductase [Kosmotoga pacifica]|uniref:NADP-dependent 3-hydroxy acid dehydrogenase YdfG n=1 Tax=Kosmotoga pacifica TaxID=1330330 RepID=A0A0G2Z4R3_9BACT|nr:SDR family oxidoreductase [Kosmotoga pacifica]AKI96600.1 short-chain dehydrogenase [Kosmotoga pacifica]